jgi:hypothetical protein
MVLTITPAVTEKISGRLRLYLSGVVQKWPGWDPEARSLQALPILPDLFTAYFLRPDGELFVVDFSEDEPKPRIEKDIHRKVTVINVATEWFPELKDLLPCRPDDAQDCPDCNGAGKFSFNDYYGQPASLPCPKCMSLGWIQH